MFDIVLILVWFFVGIVWMCLGLTIAKNGLTLGHFLELKKQSGYLSDYEKEEYTKILKQTLAYFAAYVLSTFIVALPLLT